MKVTVFTAGRTGSQFLYELIKANFDNTELFEWFSPSFVRASEEINDEEFLTYISKQMKTTNLPFASKVTPHIFDARWKDSKKNIEAVLEATKCTKQIYMCRMDFFGLCVSDWIANLTGRWHSNRPVTETRYLPFKRVVADMYQAESAMLETFKSYAGEHAAVTFYECLNASPLTFTMSTMRYITGRAVCINEIVSDMPTKRVLNSDSSEYKSIISTLSSEDLDFFYETKNCRDKKVKEILYQFEVI